MHLVYVDDSGDRSVVIYSALLIPSERWSEAWQATRRFRSDLKRTRGIPLTRELHASEFVSGHGKYSTQVLTKAARADIFRRTLRQAATLPQARIVNVIRPRSEKGRAIELILEQIDAFVGRQSRQALLVCDSGDEAFVRRATRRMMVLALAKHSLAQRDRTYLRHFVEDPVFKDSIESYFIQMVDFIAFALLRQERPTPHILRYGLETAFDELAALLVLEANPLDPKGIIR